MTDWLSRFGTARITLGVDEDFSLKTPSSIFSIRGMKRLIISFSVSILSIVLTSVRRLTTA